MVFMHAGLDDYVTAMALIGKAGATMGFSGICLYSSELYPTDVRNVGLGTSSVCARVSGMIAPYVGGPMVSAMFCNSTKAASVLIDFAVRNLHRSVQILEALQRSPIFFMFMQFLKTYCQMIG